MTPKTLQMLLIAGAILYLILPYDLIPDFFGLAGRVDDLLMMAWLTWLYQTRGAEWLGRATSERHAGETFRGAGQSEQAGGRAGSGTGGSRGPNEKAKAGPHAVLGVGAGASADEIRDAYRERMQEYHPDKVAHLGQELQELALKKSQEIQSAYRQLTE